MYQYPVDIHERRSGDFQAVWVDFPLIPPAFGPNRQAAFNALMDQSFLDVADLVAHGKAPLPSDPNDRPYASISTASVLQKPHLGRLVGVTQGGTKMTTYSWTNDLAYIE